MSIEYYAYGIFQNCVLGLLGMNQWMAEHLSYMYSMIIKTKRPKMYKKLRDIHLLNET